MLLLFICGCTESSSLCGASLGCSEQGLLLARRMDFSTVVASLTVKRKLQGGHISSCAWAQLLSGMWIFLDHESSPCPLHCRRFNHQPVREGPKAVIFTKCKTVSCVYFRIRWIFKIYQKLESHRSHLLTLNVRWLLNQSLLWKVL